jgi:N-acetylmuramic acid 6-phosphate etherase
MPSDTLAHLATEGHHESPPQLDLLSPAELVLAMNAADAEVARAVREAAPAIARAIELGRERLLRGGRLHYFGAGTSGRLAMLDAAECPPTFGVSPDVVQAHLAGGAAAFAQAIEGAEDRAELGVSEAAAAGIGPDDIVVGLSASGRTPYVLGALRRARELGALTVALACVRDSEIARVAEIAIEVATGPELLAGSTRLTAGTAQKMVLNMLSTGVMAGLGKVYGSYMVDVRVTNEKLRLRALRIIEAVAAVEADEAEYALERSGGMVKVACAVAALGLSAEEARRRLDGANGNLRAVLGDVDEGHP